MNKFKKIVSKFNFFFRGLEIGFEIEFSFLSRSPCIRTKKNQPFFIKKSLIDILNVYLHHTNTKSSWKQFLTCDF